MVDASHDLLSGPEQAEGAREGDRVVPVLGVDEVRIDVRNVRRDLNVNANRGKRRPPTALCDAGADRLEDSRVPSYVVGHHRVRGDDDLEPARVAAGRAGTVV